MEAGPLEIATKLHGADAYVILSGELCLASAARLETALAEVETSGRHKVVLDLEALSFLDVAGLRTILAAVRRARQQGICLLLVRPQQAIRRVAYLTGADAELEFVEEADPTRDRSQPERPSKVL